MTLIETVYDREWETVLRTLYLDEGKTLAEVADTLSVDIKHPLSLKTVHGWIVRAGLTRREALAKQVEVAS